MGAANPNPNLAPSSQPTPPPYEWVLLTLTLIIQRQEWVAKFGTDGEPFDA